MIYWHQACTMDSLHVTQSGNSSKPSSRSASPARPSLAPSGHTPTSLQPGSKHGKSPADGSSTGGGGSVVVRGRKHSPLTGRKEKQGSEGTPLCPRERPRTSSHQGSQEEGMAHSSAEEVEVDISFPSSGVSNGSAEMPPGGSAGAALDEVDGFSTHGTPDLHRTRAAIDHIQAKINKTKELIKSEQTSRDENVNEYLKLAANADKQQLQRIKAVFEKKNQKSSQTVAQLQKKLESYNKRLKEVELHGVGGHHRQPREVLRDVGQGLKHVGGNIRDGITGFSGTVTSIPREFAVLIKNKFGSADNISSLARNGEGSMEEEKTHHGSASLPHGSTLSGAPGSSSGGGGKYASEEGSECNSSVTSESIPHISSPRGTQLSQQITSGLSLEPLLQELQERREEVDRLREEMEGIKQGLQQELDDLNQALQEERFRYERLEEQMNDLIELHQNEIENLKSGITDMEEKVQYQSEERLRDMHEMMENCQTRISRMEHQQQQQHQQYVTLEGIENSNARALVVKLINIVLTVLQVILLLVATIAGILMPFLKTRLRILTTTLLVFAIVFIFRQWPELMDLGIHMIQHYKQVMAVK